LEVQSGASSIFVRPADQCAAQSPLNGATTPESLVNRGCSKTMLHEADISRCCTLPQPSNKHRSPLLGVFRYETKRLCSTRRRCQRNCFAIIQIHDPQLSTIWFEQEGLLLSVSCLPLLDLSYLRDLEI
jgi:hypothetical protein